LGHRFERLELLRDALTHRSFANERPHLAPQDNERLEFLGDAIAGMVASTLLWERFPDAREGELTRRRADVVRESGLEQIARELGIGDALRLGNGEERSGGREKPRLLASALEACLAAVYLDGGLEAAMAVGRRLFEPRLRGQDPGARDYKSRIQELVQAAGIDAPHYELLHAEGPDHDRTFHVAIVVDGVKRGEGTGRSKVDAEQQAAAAALALLESGQGD
jgi:ribonuclease-3